MDTHVHTAPYLSPRVKSGCCWKIPSLTAEVSLKVGVRIHRACLVIQSLCVSDAKGSLCIVCTGRVHAEVHGDHAHLSGSGHES